MQTTWHHVKTKSDKQPIDGFHGVWLHFQRARVGSVFSAAVCKIQAGERYVESLQLVPKDKRSCSSQGERFAVQLLLIAHLPSKLS